jgi:hypothetical protein
MFDFMDMLSFGKKIQSKGETWISIKYLHDGMYIAVREDALFPAPMYLVKEDKKEDKKEEVANEAS